MKIIVSQQDKKILITFESGKLVDKFVVDKAEGFINVIDKFFRKRRIKSIGQIRPIRQIGHIRFENTGILTERIIKAIIAGLRF